jgi:hypothetical protein
MDLSIIISVSGRPGLYKVVGRSKNSLIAESLTEKKRIPVLSSDKVSALSDISIFTYDGDIPLKDALLGAHDFLKGENAPDGKNNDAELMNLMRGAVPEFDEDRVYASDMRKLFNWYNLLNSQGLINREEEAPVAETATEEAKAEAPAAKKPAAKKAAPAKPEADKPTAKKPAKKKE